MRSRALHRRATAPYTVAAIRQRHCLTHRATVALAFAVAIPIADAEGTHERRDADSVVEDGDPGAVERAVCVADADRISDLASALAPSRDRYRISLPHVSICCGHRIAGWGIVMTWSLLRRSSPSSRLAS